MRRRSRPEDALGRAYLASPECPPPETFLEEAWAGLDEGDRNRIEAHVEHCPACAAERSMARAFDDARGAAPDVEADATWIVSRLERAREAAKDSARPASRAVRRRHTPTWGLAAAAVVILAVAVTLLARRSVAPPLPPPVDGPTATRGSLVEVLDPVGEVAEVPAALRWVAVAGARAYRVRVLEVDDVVVWEATVGAAETPLPETTRSGLRRGVLYRWRIEALDARGRVIGDSGPVEFRVGLPATRDPG